MLLLCLVCSFCSQGQEYNTKADLEVPKETGFYKIPITAQLGAIAKQGFSDIRIQDNATNSFVPYVLQQQAGWARNVRFIDFPILQQATTKNETVLDLENPLPSGTGVGEISLIIKNTAVHRNCMLSGSNDKQNWYIISDNLQFQPSQNDTGGNYVQTIFFPYSKSKYFRLKINNAHTDPLQIIKAGLINQSVTRPSLETLGNPVPVIRQKDSSDHCSYVFINNNLPYLVSEIKLCFTGPKFYNRNATVWVVGNKNDSPLYQNYPSYFLNLSSTKEAKLNISPQKASIIILKIENKDDAPLKISSTSTYQGLQYLIAWLEKDKKYSLLAGNENASPPQYDLASFKDSISKELKTCNYGPLVTNNVSPATQPVMVVKQKSNIWLWPVIIASLLVLAFFTYKLLDDMKKKGV